MRAEDEHAARRDAAALTFLDVPASNLSLSRDAWERAGGFDPVLGAAGRDGHEWGIRAVKAGLELAYAPAAAAAQRLVLDPAAEVEAARALGRGDTLLLSRHPEAVGAVPEPGTWRRIVDRPPEGLALLALRAPAARRTAQPALELLERARLRGAWLRLFKLMKSAAYEQGAYEAGARPPASEAPRLAVDVAGREPIPRPGAVPPLLELAVGDEEAGVVRPPGGQWGRGLVAQMAAAVPWKLYERLGSWPDVPARRTGPATTLVWGFEAGHPALGALERAGVEVVAPATAKGWAAVHGAILAASSEEVAVALPGVLPGAAALAAGRVAAQGERVALALVSGLEEEQRPSPVLLLAERMVPRPNGRESLEMPPFPAIGRTTDVVVLRRRAYEELGGLDPALAALGPQAPVLDLVQRALAAGRVVGYAETHDVRFLRGRLRTRRLGEWHRQQGRAALLVRAARREGYAGAWRLWRWGLLPLLRDVVSSARGGVPRRRPTAAAALAFCWGCCLGARDVSAPAPGRAPPGGRRARAAPRPTARGRRG
jgi:hypothetical protein